VTCSLLCALALLAAAPMDGATIANSGSTNSPGYSLALWSDGTAKLTRPGVPDTTPTLPPDLVAKFFQDVRTARAANVPVGGCMKSVSFGSRTQVHWHGWNSPDLLCPQRDASVLTLGADVRQIESTLGIVPGMMRRMPLPIGVRKILPATPEATASP
jgi:hypothetical protein